MIDVFFLSSNYKTIVLIKGHKKFQLLLKPYSFPNVETERKLAHQVLSIHNMYIVQNFVQHQDSKKTPETDFQFHKISYENNLEKLCAGKPNQLKNHMNHSNI